MDITISDNAAKRISELVAKDGRSELMLRVLISGGGCSGFTCEFSLEEKQTNLDIEFIHQGSKVVVDMVSLGYVKGSELDFVDEVMGSYFSLKNPNAKSTCGCGASFAV